MKKILKISLLAVIPVLFSGCDRSYIDPINKVNPGPDESAPLVDVSFPPEGYVIQTNDEVTSIDIKFEVIDDIEIQSISVLMDGQEIKAYSTFKDYRRAAIDYVYEEVTNGPHVLSIVAKDLSGKTTTTEVNFEKGPPYLPVYEGEVFYMPFTAAYTEMNSLNNATVTGSPGFTGAGNGLMWGDAYQGAVGAYLTFPAAGLQSTEFTASFWMKVNGTPDRAGVLVMGPPDAANPSSPNNRTKGFRFFRENANGKQRFKLNIGTGASDSWFDGGAAADVVPNTGEWTHFAFTISASEAVVYINGNVVRQGALSGIDWTGCDILSIMSGAPRFTGWGHNSDASQMDELRIFTKALTQQEIKTIMVKEQAVMHMSFDGDYADKFTGEEPTIVGTPSLQIGAGVKDDAYKGATGAYLTMPTEGLLSTSFSASFWMKVDATPDRAGVLVAGPVDEANPTAMNKRTSGFRFFRENAGGKQRFKLNVGTGAGEAWFDGGAAADVVPNTGEWTHFAFTISPTASVVYINGQVASTGTFNGVDWTGCDLMSIMSGAPRFTGWGHNSDASVLDELMLFKKTLTAEEVGLLFADGQ